MTSHVQAFSRHDIQQNYTKHLKEWRFATGPFSMPSALRRLIVHCLAEHFLLFLHQLRETLCLIHCTCTNYCAACVLTCANKPSVKSSCIMAYGCPVPEERKHQTPMLGIENSGYPEKTQSRTYTSPPFRRRTCF